MNTFGDLKEQAWESNLELHRLGLVVQTFGNVSAFDPAQGVFAIKPSGVLYEKLLVDDMVVLDLQLNVVEGKLKPSSDTKTHAVLYRNFPEIGGIAHTHSPYAVAWAQAMKPIPILGTTHADFLAMDIPCTEVMSDEMIKGDYEEETGNLIVRRFADLSYKETEMVLVANHGPFTWGSTTARAVENSHMLEEIAKMALLTLQVDPNTPKLTGPLVDKHYERKHGAQAYYGQKDN
ncbi:MAG: L-ribulose-5-phosphate 4-epimerase AraD [Ignavibacteria bacterium]|nr:L-ribulose-5-phosphate 4-epimerase AraD [Ignavibacteria bacterium]